MHTNRRTLRRDSRRNFPVLKSKGQAISPGLGTKKLSNSWVEPDQFPFNVVLYYLSFLSSQFLLRAPMPATAPFTLPAPSRPAPAPARAENTRPFPPCPRRQSRLA